VTKVSLELGERVAVRDGVTGYDGLEGEVCGVEHDRHGFPIYWVYLYELTALVKLKGHELTAPARGEG
jgi:hypothetical protein